MDDEALKHSRTINETLFSRNQWSFAKQIWNCEISSPTEIIVWLTFRQRFDYNFIDYAKKGPAGIGPLWPRRVERASIILELI